MCDPLLYFSDLMPCTLFQHRGTHIGWVKFSLLDMHSGNISMGDLSVLKAPPSKVFLKGVELCAFFFLTAVVLTPTVFGNLTRLLGEWGSKPPGVLRSG